MMQKAKTSPKAYKIVFIWTSSGNAPEENKIMGTTFEHLIAYIFFSLIINIIIMIVVITTTTTTN